MFEDGVGRLSLQILNHRGLKNGSQIHLKGTWALSIISLLLLRLIFNVNEKNTVLILSEEKLIKLRFATKAEAVKLLRLFLSGIKYKEIVKKKTTAYFKFLITYVEMTKLA